MPKYFDVSSSTSDDVLGTRKLKRRGIVIHTDEGPNALSWLQGGSAIDGRPASSDFWIARNGDIYQITPPGSFAYHTGKARYNLYQEADTTLNQGFYGIELQNWSEKGERVTDAQYIALAWLCRSLLTYRAMPYYNLTSHGVVALPAGRKHDPSGFDWAIFTVELLNPSHEWNGVLLPEDIP